MRTDMNICCAVESRAADFAEKPAFICRGGEKHTFAGLVLHARFVAREMRLLGMDGRAAAVVGDVSYSGLCAVLGCLMASVPVIVADASLSREELAAVLEEYGVGALFYSRRFSEKALAAAGQAGGLLPVPEFDELLTDAVPSAEGGGADIAPDAPAFMIFTAHGKRAAILTHKNICATLGSLAGALDISSYTFLSPLSWGGAFDLVAGILLPLSAGCTLVERGDRRSSARAVVESGATALVCTPERLTSLEKALKIRSVKTLGKLRTLLYGLAAGVGPETRLLGHRRIRALLGDSLRLIICGGAYTDADCVRQFASWGFDVYNCYYLTECGAAAISRVSGGTPVPLVPTEINPVAGNYGEIILTLAEPVRYFGADAAEGPFATGDIGRFEEDGSLEICGRRKTILLSGSGAPVFPEKISAVLCRSRYISRAAVSGRFDTGTSGILVSAVITPDYKAVASALGSKYSDNRLRLLIGRELERITPRLPHKIDEFHIAEKKS